MLSAFQHSDFASAVAEQRIADLRRQAAERALAKAVRAGKAAGGRASAKAALRAPRLRAAKAPRQVVTFIRASAHH